MTWKKVLIPLIKEAGKAIMEVYNSDIQVDLKSDNSPVTAADLAANKIIVEKLKETGIPILSEESQNESADERKNWTKVWIVDPLDGTKEFIKKTSEFTVNIALVENGTPIAGVVYAPALGTIYYGEENEALKITDEGEEKIQTSIPGSPLRIVASKSHMSEETEKFLEKIGEYTLVQSGSSLKFCLIAEGTADLYPRHGPTMEWDTAAAHAVLEAAGGAVKQLNGEELHYNKSDLKNPFFIAVGNPKIIYGE